MKQLRFASLTAVLFFPVLLFSGEVVHLKFDADLKDSAGGRLGRVIGPPVSYTADRFGNPGSAVLLKKGSRISLGNDKGLSFGRDGKDEAGRAERPGKVQQLWSAVPLTRRLTHCPGHSDKVVSYVAGRAPGV